MTWLETDAIKHRRKMPGAPHSVIALNAPVFHGLQKKNTTKKSPTANAQKHTKPYVTKG
uniref:Uncharacterized protein n=1 Tax=Anguilla anguilla TaxID=7936 RepID=A0A0E9TYL7_ANGAN